MAGLSTRQLRLAREVHWELAQLSDVARVAGMLAATPASERRPWDVAAAAKYVADLFLGLENLCKRRYRYLGLPVPEGRDSHSQMLQDFLDQPDLGGLLDAEVARRLQKYLRFRHRFAHGYGHEVTWEVVEEPLRLLPGTVTSLASVWESWLGAHCADGPPVG